MLVPGASRSTVILAGSMSSFADMSDQVKITYKQKSIFGFGSKRLIILLLTIIHLQNPCT